ncbi:nuclear transport factor 2 family protein [Devosia beringensis]|uniref:nuclear transport factor 2 family protein n=1 Tax=Devosia beringensis TaxID=2657486 RepID=UPI00186B966E|nr:nuclear transport factor 2 family protein [Devosia beringensis]
MSQILPAPLADYFAAANRHDIDAMLAPFAPDARVRDEGETHTGPTAIRAWLEHTTAKYRVTVEVIDAKIEGDTEVVTGRVSGNFPGSPANLTYRFTLGGDRIASLSIG